MRSKDNKDDMVKPRSSKDMSPFPDNFAPIFWQNQFRTTIPIPTKADIPNVEGKCAIITGSNTGLGFESARQMLALGLSHLVMGVRSRSRGLEAAAELRMANPSARIDVWHLDMELYTSVQDFVRKCDKELSRIDVLILNAGISPVQFHKTEATGHEKTIQVNHISTALLAVLLLPVLKYKASTTRAEQPPTLTLVNSVMAQLCSFPNRDRRPLLPSFDDTSVTPFAGAERYGVSKLLIQLFVVRLAELVSPEDVIINMVDPGLTKGTGLGRDAKGLVAIASRIFLGVSARPVERGAATYVNAALQQGKDSHGCFLMNCNNAP